MAKNKGNRIHIILESTESGSVYHTTKNKRNTTERLETKKFDSKLNKVVVFREKK